MYLALAIAFAYLLGSVPFAIISARIFGIGDPRKFGSGNPGATNVLRSGNKKAAALTLLGDAGKGWLAVWVVNQLWPSPGADNLSLALVAFAAFAGHVYSCFLSFKGGKGVATALGVLIGLDPLLAGVVLLVWIVTVAAFRISSLAAVTAALATPIAGAMLASDPNVLAGLIPMAAILLWRHKGNIQRILNGSESRMGSKNK